MTTDLSLLLIFLTRKNFEQYLPYVRMDLVDMEIKILLQDFEQYFKTHDVETIDLDLFPTWFFQARHPSISEEKGSIFKSIFKKLKNLAPENVQEVLKAFQEKSTSMALYQALEEKFDYERLCSILEHHEKLVASQQQDPELITNDLSMILQAADPATGLNWNLDCLQKSIKPLKKGKFVIIAAYVDVGKTTLAISEVVHMARQMKTGKILWMNNEEENLKVYRRIWQSTLGVTEEELASHQEACIQEYKKRMHGDLQRINIIDIRGKSLHFIRSQIEKYKPELVVIDQVDKISNPKFKSFSDHDRLKNLYGEIRDLNNTYCPIIAISQADRSTLRISPDSGDLKYQLYPHHGQLDGSKVGKPGEADAIIMIGRHADHNSTRGIHVSKNKFGDTIKQEVIFDGARARYLNP